jgi:hypothetical protein
MAARTGFARCVLMVTVLLAMGSVQAQNELRNTFFKEACVSIATLKTRWSAAATSR